MPRNVVRIIPAAILLAPLFLALVATWLGVPVTGRDDVNYLAELQTRPYFFAAPDQLSWIALKVMLNLIKDPVLTLRLAGFLVCLGTCALLWTKRADEAAIFYFGLSIASLYWTLYFNQLRLGLGVALYLCLLVRGRRLLAPIGGALAHSSLLVLYFPPAIIIAPFILSVMQFLDPRSFAAVRFAAYRDAEYLLMPWYFGWELFALAMIFIFEKRVGRGFGLIVYAVAVRLLADRVSVEIARRLLELGLFAYSPIVVHLSSRIRPSLLMLGLYLGLGLLALYAAISGGVVSVGGAV